MTFESLRRHALRAVLGLLAAPFVLALPAGAQTGAQPAGPALVEGQQYVRLKNPVPVESGKKIEVLEFFSYGCPHCRDLDPELQTWMKTLPPDVEFRRVPVDFGREQWANLAKAYLTLEVLGVEQKLTPDFFDALHAKNVPLYQEKAFFDWAASKGLDRKKVEETYASFGVNSKLQRARQLAKAYNIQSVPAVVVDGKFLTAPDKVGSHAAMPGAINALAQKARAERPKS